MTIARSALSLCLAVLALPALCVAAEGDPTPAQPAVTDIFRAHPIPVQPDAVSSSDQYVALPNAPGRLNEHSSAIGTSVLRNNTRAFSALGIAVKVGVAGIGFEAATPLSQKWNLRAGASFFSYDVNTTTSDGYIVAGSLKLKTVAVSADWFPFGGSFRLSPGVTLYNGNSFAATASIPGGSTFDLGDGTYTSSAADPVHGTLGLTFGNKVAPSLTAGFGNIVPRGLGKHFSVPFEFGVQFIGQPKFNLVLTGTACDTSQPGATGCAPIATDPTAQANIKQQNADLNSDVSGLRAYPILSIGFGYKF